MTSHSINNIYKVYLRKSFSWAEFELSILRLEAELTNNNAINFKNFIMTKQ